MNFQAIFYLSLRTTIFHHLYIGDILIMASPKLEAQPLHDGVLPTKLQLYQLYLHLDEVNKISGEWGQALYQSYLE